VVDVVAMLVLLSLMRATSRALLLPFGDAFNYGAG